MASELREYQTGAIESLRMARRQGDSRLMLYSPTGSGKTEIGMAVIKSAIEKGRRVVFLCNRIQLVSQTSKRFLRSGIRHGIMQGQNTHSIDRQVVIASIKTVARRGMPDCDLIVIDEAHGVAGSREYREVLFKLSAVPVIGLTATPFAKGLGKHYDELGGALFETLVKATTISDLIDQGYLVDCEIYAPSEPDMSGVKQTRNAFGEMDWSDMDVGKAADTPKLVGDIVDHWLRLANDTPTVCFASNIAHSKHIVESFRAAGVSAEHIDCYTDEDERTAILQRVESGETRIISNVGILTEGWDFPACKTLILARPTKSMIRYIQMIGRVLRPHESKEFALVLDHSGTVSRLGFPTQDFDLELDDGKPKSASKAKDREEPLPKVCPECKFVKPPKAPFCPRCGHKSVAVSEVTSEDGELVLLSKGKKAKFEDKQDVYSQLLHLRKDRGYSDGWVANQYRNIFGVWPRGMRNVATPPSPELKSWITSQNIRYAKSKETKR